MPVPDNTIRANIRATVGATEEVVHTLHFHRVNTTQTDNPSLQEIANKVRDEWTLFIESAPAGFNAVSSFMRQDLDYATVDVYSLNPDGTASGQAQAAFVAGVDGTSASTVLAPELAIVASLKTGLPGRSKRGRLYLGGFSSNANDVGGTVALAAQNSIANALRIFGTNMKMQVGANVDRLNWVVLSRTLTEVNRITQIRVGNLWDVQRRRQNGLLESYVNQSISY